MVANKSLWTGLKAFFGSSLKEEEDLEDTANKTITLSPPGAQTISTNTLTSVPPGNWVGVGGTSTSLPGSWITVSGSGGGGGGSSITSIFMMPSERDLNPVFTRDYALNVRCTKNLIQHLQKCCYDHYRRNKVKDRYVQENLEMLQNMYQTKSDIIAKQQALLNHLNDSTNHSDILKPTQWLKQV